jgi:hypothetical protein
MMLSPLKPLGLSRELSLQIARLNHHANRLAQALASLASINECLTGGKLDQAKEAISLHKATFGHSLIIAKKELFVALQVNGHSGLVEAYRNLTTEYQRTAWSVLCHYIYDVMDPTIDPIRAGRIWLGITAQRMHASPWYCSILQQEVLGAPATESTFADALLRYSAFSLLDLVVFLWRVLHTFCGASLIKSSWQTLDHRLKDILANKFSELPITIPTAYRRSSDHCPDTELYRVASPNGAQT